MIETAGGGVSNLVPVITLLEIREQARFGEVFLVRGGRAISRAQVGRTV